MSKVQYSDETSPTTKKKLPSAGSKTCIGSQMRSYMMSNSPSISYAIRLGELGLETSRLTQCQNPFPGAGLPSSARLSESFSF